MRTNAKNWVGYEASPLPASQARRTDSAVSVHDPTNVVPRGYAPSIYERDSAHPVITQPGCPVSRRGAAWNAACLSACTLTRSTRDESPPSVTRDRERLSCTDRHAAVRRTAREDLATPHVTTADDSRGHEPLHTQRRKRASLRLCAVAISILSWPSGVVQKRSSASRTSGSIVAPRSQPGYRRASGIASNEKSTLRFRQSRCGYRCRRGQDVALYISALIKIEYRRCCRHQTPCLAPWPLQGSYPAAPSLSQPKP